MRLIIDKALRSPAMKYKMCLTLFNSVIANYTSLELILGNKI